MFDPDNPKTKPILAKSTQPNPRLTPISAIPMDEKDRLRYYLINCSGTRKYFGFGLDANKKLTVIDQKKLERLDHETKAILRELYLELK